MEISVIASPCIEICILINKITHMECKGCGRTQEEIREWLSYTDKERSIILKKLKEKHNEL